jgi:hypothetical protein
VTVILIVVNSEHSELILLRFSFFFQGVTVIYSKRGGNTTVGSHSEWLLTVPATPDVINVKAVPITSLVKGVPGAGYLSHAINLYLRCK